MFVLSKLASGITQPLFWLALWWLAALVLIRRHRRPALVMLWSGWLLLGALGIQALPDALLRALETRHAPPPAESLPKHAGLIVLGGALGHPASFLAHGQVPLNDAAERMTSAVALMRRYPQFELVFSGGEGRLWSSGVSEATLARAFFEAQGIEATRLVFETRSRSTRENAREVANLLGARCGQPWLLVTSAWHMPRALEEFAAAGCHVTPYPVDYRTGEATPLAEYSLARSLMRWQTALHEWLGLGVYRLTR